MSYANVGKFFYRHGILRRIIGWNGSNSYLAIMEYWDHLYKQKKKPTPGPKFSFKVDTCDMYTEEELGAKALANARALL